MRSRLTTEDCLVGMARLADDSIDMCCTDPPFNIGEDYDIYDDRKAYDDYMDSSRRWLTEIYRVLKPSGAFWLHMGDELVADLKVQATKDVGFKMVSWVLNYYTFGVNTTKKKLTRSHAHFLYFCKPGKKQDRKFNAETLLVPSARQMTYNDKRANPEGRCPDDTWILRPQFWPQAFHRSDDSWFMSRICGTFKERVGTPNQLPERLVARPIRLCSNPGDVVLDCFSGSGTVAAVCKKLGRKYIAFEISPTYNRHAKNRLDDISEGDDLAGPSAQGDIETE